MCADNEPVRSCCRTNCDQRMEMLLLFSLQTRTCEFPFSPDWKRVSNSLNSLLLFSSPFFSSNISTSTEYSDYSDAVTRLNNFSTCMLSIHIHTQASKSRLSYHAFNPSFYFCIFIFLWDGKVGLPGPVNRTSSWFTPSVYHISTPFTSYR